jgi:hypothetical protein
MTTPTASDRGLWITWYDLRADFREEHLAWLHGDYIPKLLKHPGFLYAAHYAIEKTPPTARRRHTQDASVPTGSEFILIVGAQSVDAFSVGAETYVTGAPSRFEADLSKQDREMLAMRSGPRGVLAAESVRIEGPEAGQREPGSLLAPCIQVGSYNTANPDVEAELLSWYADFRMPALSRMPGCIAVRRFMAVVGWAKHGVIYEFVSREARAQHWPSLARDHPEMEEWSNRLIPHLTHAPGSASPAHRIWPPVAQTFAFTTPGHAPT